MIRTAISSWSLHGMLGQVWYAPSQDGKLVNQNAGHSTELSLLELPAFVAGGGIPVLEICHFHFPSVDDDYLMQVKNALEAAGVELANILIDTGNLSSLDEAQWRADIELTKFWQDIAAKLGAKGVRIDCGTESATVETIKRSAEALQELADYGSQLGLITTTENWRATSIYADDLIEIMRQVDRPLNLCLDFGNAEKTADKYATITQLLPYATSLHCKADYHADGQIDVEELDQCFRLVSGSNFDGHITLIYGDTKDEWNQILALKQLVEEQMLAN